MVMDMKRLMTIAVVLGLVLSSLLLLGTFSFETPGSDNDKKTNSFGKKATTIYVGPDQTYKSIQAGVDAASVPDAAITLHTHCSSRDCAKGIALTKDKIPQAMRSSIHEISADTSSDRAVSATHASLVHLGDQPDQSRAPPAA